MTTWILTIGDSDVLVKPKTANEWNTLERQAKAATPVLRSAHFVTREVITTEGEKLFYYPARALGLVYASQLEKHGTSLRFPRLDALVQQLDQCQKPPRRIVVLLTDQSNLFSSSQRKPYSPYWRDTCELKPILQFYLTQKLPDATQEYLTVTPDPSHPGLDHWEKTLGLIQILLATLECPPRKPIYVSQQAGTPALSSAVQFVALTQFGSQVQFLVSSEIESAAPELIPSSVYLWGIRLQEAHRLLERYDYAGVLDVLNDDLAALNQPNIQTLKHLLDSANLWNQAQFANFANSLSGEPPVQTQEWWWAGYESAYLATIRLQQGNTVEALFHSFRAAEGMLSDWAKWYYPDDIKTNKTGAPMVFLREGSRLPGYLQQEIRENKDNQLMLYSERLFKLFRVTRPDAVDNEDVNVIWKDAKGVRNQQFHRLLGLSEKAVFRAWHTKENPAAWEKRLVNCLNKISGQSFGSLKEASLMSAIHGQIETELTNNTLKPEPMET